MAKPIELVPGPCLAQDDIRRKMDDAPLKHADAILSALDLLEELHKSGTLDLLRGATGAGSEIIKQVAELAARPESIRVMRNLLLIGQLFSSIDPDALHGIIGAFQAASEQREQQQKPPSLFRILRRLSSEDSRYTLEAMATIVEGIGQGLNPRSR